MRRLLAFLAAMLVVWPAFVYAKPSSIEGSTSSTRNSTSIKFSIGDTSDSDAIAVSGFCSVRYQQAGGDDAALYAVPTAATAATSGTLIGTFTSSTTTATTFTAGTRWVKAVATDATVGGSVMVIDCSPLTGGGGGASQATFAATTYATGSPTGGIVEALAACSLYVNNVDRPGGGVVILPPGLTTIDATASGVTNPVIDMPTTLSTNQAACDLIGYGDTAPAPGSTTMQSGSTIKITNASGVVGIRVNASGQVLSDFSCQMTGTNASSKCIEVASKTYASGCDGTCEKGELGISNWVIDNVTITGPASLGPGIGLDLTYALKGIANGGEIQRWDSGVNFSDPADVTGFVGHSNANDFSGVKIRENDIGINATNAHGFDMLTLHANTIEGNEIGAYISGPTGALNRRLIDYNGHWENGSCTGCTASAENLRLSTNGGATPEPVQFIGFGTWFGGVASLLDITRDYYNSGWEPDVCVGCFFSKGVTYTNAARLVAIQSNMFEESTAGAYTNVIGTTKVPPSFDPTCTSFYGGTTTEEAVTGDYCFDATNKVPMVCVAGSDGVCNSAGEWYTPNGYPVTSTGTTGTTPMMNGEFNVADHGTATSDVNYTLPSAVPGMRGCFYDQGQGDGGVSVDTASGDQILLDGVHIGVGDKINSPGVAGAGANGDMICLFAIDDTNWATYARSGTWVDGGP